MAEISLSRGKEVQVDAERAALVAAIDTHEGVVRRAMARSGPHPLLESGLTMQQLRVLILLDEPHPVPHGDLAHALGVGLATVTGLVDRLAGRGLVERSADPTDRRVRLVGLSAEGVELLERVGNAGREMQARMLARLDLDALRQLAHGLAALRGAMEIELGGVPEPVEDVDDRGAGRPRGAG